MPLFAYQLKNYERKVYIIILIPPEKEFCVGVFYIYTSAVPVRKVYSYKKKSGRLSSFFMDGQMRLFEGGTSGIFRFVVKSDIPGCNWPFLTIFDFAIIFRLKNYLLGVIMFSTTSHV